MKKNWTAQQLDFDQKQLSGWMHRWVWTEPGPALWSLCSEPTRADSPACHTGVRGLLRKRCSNSEPVPQVTPSEGEGTAALHGPELPGQQDDHWASSLIWTFAHTVHFLEGMCWCSRVIIDSWKCQWKWPISYINSQGLEKCMHRILCARLLGTH